MIASWLLVLLHVIAMFRYSLIVAELRLTKRIVHPKTAYSVNSGSISLSKKSVNSYFDVQLFSEAAQNSKELFHRVNSYLLL